MRGYYKELLDSELTLSDARSPTCNAEFAYGLLGLPPHWIVVKTRQLISRIQRPYVLRMAQMDCVFVCVLWRGEGRVLAYLSGFSVFFCVFSVFFYCAVAYVFAVW